MKILEGRRMAAVCAAYVGIFSAYILLPNMRRYVFIIAISVFVLFAVNLFLRTRGQKFSVRKAAALILMAFILIAACLKGSVYAEKTDASARFYADGEVHTAEGRVTKVLYEEIYGSSYEMQLIFLDRKETEIGLILSLPYNGELSVGDIVRFYGEMNEISGTYEFYQKADGVFLSSETEDIEVIGRETDDFQTFLEKIRAFVSNNFETYLHQNTAGLANALMLGKRDVLDSSLRLAYTRLGISHILAVSGLHLSILIGGLDFLLQQFYIGKKFRSIILILCAFFFACMCGLSASVIRAAVMMSLFYIADFVGERHDSPTALFFAVFLIVFFRPNSVYDVSMWLSFLATLGILAVLPVLSVFSVSHDSKWYIPGKIAFYFISLVGMSLAATFFTLPVIWVAFGGISLIAPVANLIFVPLTQIILYLLLFLTLFSRFPLISTKIGTIVDTLAETSENWAEKLSALDGIYISLRYPFVPALLAALTVGVLAVLLIKKIHPAWLFAVFAVFAVAFAIGYGGYAEINRGISFVYLETDGKSDTVGFISEGKTMIVDISTGGDSVYTEISDRIADFYESEIDVFVLTHYHRYHARTLRKLTGELKIHKILLPRPQTEKEQEYFEGICASIGGNAEIVIYEPNGTQTETMGEIRLHLPETEYLKRSSHPLVCFSVDIGGEGKGFSYFGSGVTETNFADEVRSVTVLGVHGPTMKNIFDGAPLSKAELVIFSEKSVSDWSEYTWDPEKTVYAEDYNGYVKITFE